jgi:hypothetical protein
VSIEENHDRFARDWIPTQEPGDLFEAALGTPIQYPYVVGYRRPDLSNSPQEPALLLFVFDSTPSMITRMSPLNRIARGCIETAECRWLVDCVKHLETSRVVTGLNGEPVSIDYEQCARVAVSTITHSMKIEQH